MCEQFRIASSAFYSFFSLPRSLYLWKFLDVAVVVSFRTNLWILPIRFFVPKVGQKEVGRGQHYGYKIRAYRKVKILTQKSRFRRVGAFF